MERTSRRIIVAVAVVAAWAVPLFMPSRTVGDPPEEWEWRDYGIKTRAAVARGDFRLAETITNDLLTRCRASVGNLHPDATTVEVDLQGYRQLQGLDEDERKKFAAVITRLNIGWQTIQEPASQTLPSQEQLCSLLRTFRPGLNGQLERLSYGEVVDAARSFGIASVLCFAQMPDTAKPFAVSAHERLTHVPNFLYVKGLAELQLAMILSELGKEPEKQIDLLTSNVEFPDRYERTARLEFWKERSMTLLAETYYRQGNRHEADRLFAEVRSKLPAENNNNLPGWCRSWCDRHEARQLMEKGDWDEAYDKIFQARVGTINYGSHNPISKGLTMERILRMSAEIQRKRGNDKEAEDDLEYAQSIANHAARLREALTAELKSLELNEDSDSRKPAAAPSS